MLDKNSIAHGLLFGILFPILGFAIAYGLFELLDLIWAASQEGLRPFFRERTSALLGIATNAYLLNRFQKNRQDNSVRGLVLITLALVAGWIFRYKDFIFQ